MDPLKLEINANSFVKRVFIFFVSCEVFFVLADIFINRMKWSSYAGFRGLFNTAKESSIPNWFSATQLLLIGLIAAIVALLTTRSGQESSEKRGLQWGFLSGFFVFLGFDDGVALHEKVGSYLKNNAEDADRLIQIDTDFFPSYEWQMVFGPIFAATGFYLLHFLWLELKSKQLKVYFVTGLSLLALAIVVDFIEGMDPNPQDKLATALSIKASVVRHYMKSFEEFIEMLGATFILVTVLKHLLESFPRIEVEID